MMSITNSLWCYSQEPETVHLIHLSCILVDRCVVSLPLFFLKSAVSSLAMMTLSNSLFSGHCSAWYFNINSNCCQRSGWWCWCHLHTSQWGSFHVSSCSHGCRESTGGGWAHNSEWFGYLALERRRCDWQFWLSRVCLQGNPESSWRAWYLNPEC